MCENTRYFVKEYEVYIEDETMYTLKVGVTYMKHEELYYTSK